jgi:hypothetical protein
MPAYLDTGLNLIDVKDCARGHILAEQKGVPGERYILGNQNMSLLDILVSLEKNYRSSSTSHKNALLGGIERRLGL